MKSKEEILQQYYSLGADGLPEISADGLLKAMEEYRQQAEEKAFYAARELTTEGSNTNYAFLAFDDYKASLQIVQPTTEHNEAQKIQFIADSILEQFLPENKDETTVSFEIRTEGTSYQVTYDKNQQGYWEFNDYELC